MESLTLRGRGGKTAAGDSCRTNGTDSGRDPHVFSIEERLDRTEQRYRSLLETTFEGVVTHEGGIIVGVNSVFQKLFGYPADDLIGRSVLDLMVPSSRPLVNNNIKTRYRRPYEAVGVCKDGREIHVEIIAMEEEFNDRIVRVAAFRDLTRQKRTEEALRSANIALEAERLRLEKKNTAMEGILDQIEEERDRLTAQVHSNMRRIVLPITRFIEPKLTGGDRHYLTLLQSCLADITAPFVHKLEKQNAGLSPRETELCNMIRGGMSSKDIASILNISVHTVLKLRQRIRTKLGIANADVNLQSYLKTI